MSEKLKLNESTNTKFNNRINLNAIKKEDPFAQEIVDHSSYVAFYKFKNDWEKTGIEGSFFVYSRGNIEPQYSIFINNTKNQFNLIEPLSKKIEFQNQPPFLLYRNEKNEINGLWFGTSDCERIHELLNQLIKESYSNPRNEKPQNTSNGSTNNKQSVDIFSMLSKAQEEYHKGNANVVNNNHNNSNPGAALNLNKQHQMDSNQSHVNLTQQFSNIFIQKEQQPPQVQNQHPKSIDMANFFAAAQNPNPNGVIQQVHTVDEIEKQHRVYSPTVMQMQNAKMDLSSGQIKMVKRTNGEPPNANQHQTALLKLMQSGMKQFPMTPQNLNNSGSYPKSEEVTIQQFHQFQQQVIGTQVSAPIPIPNMAPMVQRVTSPSLSLSHSLNSSKPTLMPPTMFIAKQDDLLDDPLAASTSMSSTTTTVRPEPLTQNQLLQALNYLLENDTDFMKKIHEAYLKSFNKIVSL